MGIIECLYWCGEAGLENKHNTFLKCNAKINEIIYTLYHSSLMKYCAYYIRRYYIWRHTQRLMRPQEFWGAGKAIFSKSWEALVIILGKLGSKLILFGIYGVLAKIKK